MTNRAVAERYLRRILLSGAKLNGYEPRAYQISAAHRCADQLVAGKNAVLTLPTGTGKTLICGMSAAMFLRERGGDDRVLVTAPRVGLLGQLRERSRWLSPTYSVVDLGMNSSHDDHHLLPLFQRGKIIFGMAGWLANRANDGRLPVKLLSSVRLLIVDEFDAYLTLDYAEGGVRFHEPLQRLRQHLDPTCVLLLVSATTPLKSTEVGASNIEAMITAGQEAAFRDFLDKSLSPSFITMPESSYRRYIPHAEIRAVGVIDRWVEGMDAAIEDEIDLHLNWIVGEIKAPIDASYVFPRISGILSGRLPLVQGRSTVLTPRLRFLLRRLQWASHLGDFLFEDMAANFWAEHRLISKFSLIERRWYPASVLRIETRTVGGSRMPEPRAKLQSLFAILGKHVGEKGVVFFRNVRILEEVATRLLDAGITLVTYHGDQTPEARSQGLARFRAGKVALLLITRDSGKRGLDLPEGDFAVFYSPKSRDDVTWQEVSRIRGTIHNKKPTYVLYYANTAEQRKWEDLAAALRRSQRSITIEDHRIEIP